MRHDATVAALPPRAMFDLRGAPDAVARCLAAAGLAAPAKPNSVRADGEREVFWVGPRRWLVAAPIGDEAALERALIGASGESTLAANVSDLFATFRVAGPGAADVLAQGAPLDLHPRAFAADRATFTELFATTALLRRRGDGFEIAVERSYAGYIESWLKAASTQAPP